MKTPAPQTSMVCRRKFLVQATATLAAGILTGCGTTYSRFGASAIGDATRHNGSFTTRDLTVRVLDNAATDTVAWMNRVASAYTAQDFQGFGLAREGQLARVGNDVPIKFAKTLVADRLELGKTTGVSIEVQEAPEIYYPAGSFILHKKDSRGQRLIDPTTRLMVEGIIAIVTKTRETMSRDGLSNKLELEATYRGGADAAPIRGAGIRYAIGAGDFAGTFPVNGLPRHIQLDEGGMLVSNEQLALARAWVLSQEIDRRLAERPGQPPLKAKFELEIGSQGAQYRFVKVTFQVAEA
ncbi:MAG: hypothetical protein H6935_08875 [Thiobacillus sp.]|nr:hypothetical protein [Thiobacillus sp.]